MLQWIQGKPSACQKHAEEARVCVWYLGSLATNHELVALCLHGAVRAGTAGKTDVLHRVVTSEGDFSPLLSFGAPGSSSQMCFVLTYSGTPHPKAGIASEASHCRALGTGAGAASKQLGAARKWGVCKSARNVPAPGSDPWEAGQGETGHAGRVCWDTRPPPPHMEGAAWEF